jgi:NADH-quinone oxidoreductase subunit M
MAMMLSLVAILLFLGLYPQSLLNTSQAAMAGIHHVYTSALSTTPNIAP